MLLIQHIQLFHYSNALTEARDGKPK